MKQYEYCRQGWRVLLAFLALLPIVSLADEKSGTYTYAMFRKGLDEGFTVTSAPHFILIRLGGEQGPPRVICLPGSFLEGAIHEEYKIPYTVRGVEQAREIAKANWNKVFVFRNRKARRNIQPRYDSKTLESAREQVARIMASRNNLSSKQSTILEKLIVDRMDQGESAEKTYAFRDAVAHALLERGILVRESDLTGGLRIDSNGRKN